MERPLLDIHPCQRCSFDAAGSSSGSPTASRSVDAATSDYWLIPLDGAWSIRSARGIEAEGFDCIAAARHWIEEHEAEEADELAALADFEADQIREAA